VLAKSSTSSYQLVIIFFQLGGRAGPVVDSRAKFWPTKKRSARQNKAKSQPIRLGYRPDTWSRRTNGRLTHSPTLAAVVLEDALVGPGLGHAFQFGVPHLAVRAEGTDGQRKSVNMVIGVKTDEEKHVRPAGWLVNRNQRTNQDLHVGSRRLGSRSSTLLAAGCDQGAEGVVGLQDGLAGSIIHSARQQRLAIVAGRGLSHNIHGIIGDSAQVVDS